MADAERLGLRVVVAGEELILEPPSPLAQGRYRSTSEVKCHGRTYTPAKLAQFVAEAMVHHTPSLRGSVNILDPAIGDGELVLSLLHALAERSPPHVRITGFETDAAALQLARERIHAEFPAVELEMRHEDFISFAAETVKDRHGPLLTAERSKYDLIIANPPYVRTQAMGAERAARLSACFGLTGRTDLYHLFLVAVGWMADDDATVGLIASNRFMTTRAGAKVRASLSRLFELRHVWDLGDTKLFDAAVLPAVLIGSRTSRKARGTARFSTIYETDGPAQRDVDMPLDALRHDGVARVADGRRFAVRHGLLDRSDDDEAIWRLSTSLGAAWLATVERNSARRLGDIGKVRVGVKTCADKVFIRREWPRFVERLSGKRGSTRLKLFGTE